MAETERHVVEQVEEFFESENPELVRRLAQTIRGLLEGKGNNHYNVTLDVNKTTTIIQVTSASLFSQVQFSAQSSSAAAAIAAGVVWAEIITEGEITIHHDISQDTDRKLAVVLQG